MSFMPLIGRPDRDRPANFPPRAGDKATKNVFGLPTNVNRAGERKSTKSQKTFSDNKPHSGERARELYTVHYEHREGVGRLEEDGVLCFASFSPSVAAGQQSFFKVIRTHTGNGDGERDCRTNEQRNSTQRRNT